MPYKIGEKNSKGWQILKNARGKWKVVAHSNTRHKAESSIKARLAGKHNPKW